MDKTIYQQILYNIFQNACKFNVMEGKISVRFGVEWSSQTDNLINLQTEVED